MSDFGSSFRNARESRGWTLEQIAGETRIGTRFLEAIENETFSVLPGGIFSRGFVRAYADKLGLDVERSVAEFERLSNYREPPLMEGLRVSSTPEPGKINRAIYPLALVALLLVISVFYLVTRSSNTAVAVTIAPPTLTPPAPISEPATPTPAPEPPPATTTAVAATTPTASAVKEALALVIEATERTWIKVLTDGTPAVAGEILEPGMVRRFTAQNSITLSIGNAGGLILKINDQEMRPLGKSGQVRFVVIKPENVKDLIS